MCFSERTHVIFSNFILIVKSRRMETMVPWDSDMETNCFFYLFLVLCVPSAADIVFRDLLQGPT